MVLFGSEPNLFQSFGGMDRCIGTKHRKKTALNLELAQTLNSTSPTASIYQINLPIPLSPRPSSRSPAPIPTRDPIPIPISPPSSAPISAPVTLPNGCFKCPVCPRSKFRTQSQAKSVAFYSQPLIRTLLCPTADNLTDLTSKTTTTHMTGPGYTVSGATIHPKTYFGISRVTRPTAKISMSVPGLQIAEEKQDQRVQ